MPDEKKTGVQAQPFHMETLPHPDILRQYEKILPGSTDRILRMAEKISDHIMAIESGVINSNIKLSFLGWVSATIIVMMFVTLGGALVYLNRNIEGFVSMITPVAAVAGIFIYGKKEQKKELAKKRKETFGAD